MHESEKEDERGENHGLIWVCEDQADSLQSIQISHPSEQLVARRTTAPCRETSRRRLDGWEGPILLRGLTGYFMISLLQNKADEAFCTMSQT